MANARCPDDSKRPLGGWDRVYLPALVLFIGGSVALWRLGQTPLYNTEAAFAEVGREMLESADWLTPRFDYDRFLDKPPLYYWFSLLSYRFFGVNEAAARLPAALASVGTVGLTLLAGFLLFDAAAAWLAGLFLACTVGFFVYSHCVLVEPLLTFWITATLVSFWWYYSRPDRESRLWMMYLSLAMGFLTKGLTALVFPLASICLFLILVEGPSKLKLLVSWKGWAAFLGISLPWHAWIAWRNPGYLWFHFVHEQFLRFLDLRTIKDAPLPTPVFWGLLVPLLFPWSFFFPQAFHFYAKKFRQEHSLSRPESFVLVWAAVVLGFFSFSKFKLDYYSLPAWPPIALALAHSIVSRVKRADSWKPLLAPVGVLALSSASAWILFSWIAKRFAPTDLPDPWFLPAAKISLGWIFLGSSSALIFLSQRKFKFGILCLACMMFPIISLAQRAELLLTPSLSSKGIAQDANQCLASLPHSSRLVEAETDEDIYVGGDVFYTRRKVWLVMAEKDQVFPMGRKYYLSPEELDSWWRAGEPLLLLGDSGKVSNLLAGHVPYLLKKRGDKVLVSNQRICGGSPGLGDRLRVASSRL